MKNTENKSTEENIKKKLSTEQKDVIEKFENYIEKIYGKKMTQININTLINYLLHATKENDDKNKGKPYSDSWKKKVLFAIKAYYNELGKPTKLIDKFADMHFKKMIKDELEDQNQSQKEKENYLTYDELNIILRENEEYSTKRQMIQYLLLASICTDQPPLRPQIYADLEIVHYKKDIKDDDNNYMYINRQHKSGYLYINSDKVDKNNKHNKIIDLQPVFLKIVIESLKKYPRNKFIECDLAEPEQKLLYELRKAVGNNFSFDMARSSYVNDWNKKNPDATDAEKIKLAQMMRHTIQAQMTYYKKKETVTGNLEKIKAKKEAEKAIKEDGKKDEEPKVYEKYKEVNKIRALIAKANREKYKIKEETMNRYGILVDNDGKYYYPKQKKE